MNHLTGIEWFALGYAVLALLLALRSWYRSWGR